MIGTDSPVQYDPAEEVGGAPPADARDSVTGKELTAMQTPAPFTYERATSVEAAIASLVKHDGEARIIAGGHSLLPMMKLRLAHPEHLIDINDLDELSYIRRRATRSGSARSRGTSDC